MLEAEWPERHFRPGREREMKLFLEIPSSKAESGERKQSQTYQGNKGRAMGAITNILLPASLAIHFRLAGENFQHLPWEGGLVPTARDDDDDG